MLEIAIYIILVLSLLAGAYSFYCYIALNPLLRQHAEYGGGVFWWVAFACLSLLYFGSFYKG